MTVWVLLPYSRIFAYTVDEPFSNKTKKEGGGIAG
jgi:hypothetical protein